VPPLNSGEFKTRPRSDEEQDLFDEIERFQTETSMRMFNLSQSVKWRTVNWVFDTHKTLFGPLMSSYRIDGDPDNIWTRTWVEGQKYMHQDGFRSVLKNDIEVYTDRVSIEEGKLREIEGSRTHQFSCSVIEDDIYNKNPPLVTRSRVCAPGYNDFQLDQRIEFLTGLNDTLELIEHGVRGTASSNVQVTV